MSIKIRSKIVTLSEDKILNVGCVWLRKVIIVGVFVCTRQWSEGLPQVTCW